MATHINNQTIASTYSSPDISYLVSYVATRNSNSQVTYDFTIKSLLVGSSSSALGTGSTLKCTITVNGVSGSATLKETSDKWNGGSSAGTVKATDTISITCPSTTGNANQTVTFAVTRPDGLGNSGMVSTSDYYVTSPALLTYTVTYDANGGTGAPSSGTKTHGVNYTLSTVIPKRTGYTFVCWNTAKDGSGTDKNPGGIYYANAPITFYAQWKENTLTVNYWSNGADYLSALSSVTVKGDVEKGKNILIVSTEVPYDNACQYGLYDYAYSGASLYLTYTGHRYAKHTKEDGVLDVGWWGTSKTGGTLIHQYTSFASGQALAKALGLDLSSKSQTVDVYAQWENDNVKIKQGDDWVSCNTFVKQNGEWVECAFNVL